MRVLAISGSLRRASHNTALLRAAAGELPPAAELEIYEDLAAVPPYSEDLDGEGPPREAAWLRDAIMRADAILVATPEYNSSVPGQLKNALDWASRPFPDNSLRRKPAAVIGASTGVFGAVWAQAEVRRTLTASGARVIDEELPVGHADDAFAGDGKLVDPALRQQLAAMLQRLVEMTLDPNLSPAPG